MFFLFFLLSYLYKDESVNDGYSVLTKWLIRGVNVTWCARVMPAATDLFLTLRQQYKMLCPSSLNICVCQLVKTHQISLGSWNLEINRSLKLTHSHEVTENINFTLSIYSINHVSKTLLGLINNIHSLTHLSESPAHTCNYPLGQSCGGSIMHEIII